ncbi:Fasting-inducible integral membrane protein tm6p1 [Fasciola hepatica]|uniref:Fasting-inducible integral membrane protein tm6p1 n=1 Tax=Fasciola hepatica TaxID=6192 RepID=A0A4E0RVN7_FASHE|nr:Fasting-inducible integral membrane protein tm6p1 [Fasciola hepatica]
MSCRTDKRGLHYIPIAACLLIISACVISYSISATYGHSSLLFPYISDTAALKPERCFFGQLMNMAAALSGFCMYCWHKQAVQRLALTNRQRGLNFCRAALWFGLGSSFGGSVVANFQETGVWTVHMLGAVSLFVFGIVYVSIVTHVSRCYFTQVSNLWQFRAVLAVISTISGLLLPTTGTVARYRYDGMNIRIWTPENQGYGFHVVSSLSEWILTASLLMFYVTMTFELKDYTIVAVKVQHRWSRTQDDCEVVLS